MAPDDPTVQTFRMRFPEFPEVTYPNEIVGFALEEAALIMGNWPSDKGRAPAMLYLAAHILSVNTQASTTGGLTLRHETLGRISQSFADVTGSGQNQMEDLSSTSYGKRYQRLQQKVVGPFAVIGHHKSWWSPGWGWSWP